MSKVTGVNLKAPYSQSYNLREKKWEFPGGPVVIGLHAPTAGGMGLIPGRGTKILHAAWHGQKKKKK